MTRLFSSLVLGVTLLFGALFPAVVSADMVDVPVEEGVFADWMAEEASLNESFANHLAEREQAQVAVPHRVAPENKTLALLLIYCGVIAVTGFAIRFVFIDIEE